MNDVKDFEAIYLEKTDSTNDYLKSKLLEGNLPEGTVIYTDFQTVGKGQRGNAWESEQGKNLLFSMVFYPKTIKANEQFFISQAVAVGVADFLRKHSDNISIKWSNDIYWCDKKICGMLIENSLQKDYIIQSVVGVGININQIEFESDAPNPISLKQITGKEYDIYEMLQSVCQCIFTSYNRLTEGENKAISSYYHNFLFRKEGFHTYNDGEKDFFARIKEIEPNGRLVLETEDGLDRGFFFKEVKFVL